MENNLNEDKSAEKPNFLDWILWWRINPSELKRQVDGYLSLNVLESARGISLLCLIVSSVLTILIMIYKQEYVGFLDVIILLTLGFFMFKGHRWAMITAMIFWTFEKIYSFINPPFGMHASPGLFGIIWWAVYMHAFWLAYQVEIERNKPVPEEISPIEEGPDEFKDGQTGQEIV